MAAAVGLSGIIGKHVTQVKIPEIIVVVRDIYQLAHAFNVRF
jgi:hypothetical protein